MSVRTPYLFIPRVLFIPILAAITLSLFFLSYKYISTLKSSWQQTTDQLLSTESEMSNILKMLRQSVDFEVFGRVQGVFFRKYTRDKGKELGLKGWVMNTSQGTVVGTIQGLIENVEKMKDWLERTGSPMSNVEKCEFSNARHISKEEFSDFFIKP